MEIRANHYERQTCKSHRHHHDAFSSITVQASPDLGAILMSSKSLGVGFIGSGFNARFHIRSWVGVRDADVRGLWSPNRQHAEEAAALARSLRVGDAKAF